MNDKLNKSSDSEEVDLLMLFGFFESKIKSVFKLFFGVLKSILGMFVSVLKELFLKIKIVVPVLLVALVLGVIADINKDKVYYSEMYVTPNFDAKYELIGNIDYYNSLIKLKDFDELSQCFDLNKEEAKSLLQFEIEIGPESKNEQILEFNSFIKQVDSTTRSKIVFKDFIEDRNIFHARMYLLRVRSTEYKIFQKLQGGLNKSVAKTYSSLKRQENDAILGLEEANLESSLKEIQKMKATYLEVLEKEANKNNISSSLSNSLGLQVEKTETKEDKLLDKELVVLNKLSNIKKERILNNTVFDNFSSFKEKGLLENTWYRKYKIILPLLALFCMFVFYISKKVYKGVLSFE